MSASGLTPVPATSRASSSPATSSSHQPAAKSLRALDEPEGDHDSPKQITDSTDDDLLPESVAQPVDATGGAGAACAKGEGEDDADHGHDADDFVPNPNRGDTLEPEAGASSGAASSSCGPGARVSGDAAASSPPAAGVNENTASTFTLTVKAEVFDIGDEIDNAKTEAEDDKSGGAEKVEGDQKPSTAVATEAEGPPPKPSFESPPPRAFAVNSARSRSVPPTSRSEDSLGSTRLFKQKSKTNKH